MCSEAGIAPETDKQEKPNDPGAGSFSGGCRESVYGKSNSAEATVPANRAAAMNNHIKLAFATRKWAITRVIDLHFYESVKGLLMKVLGAHDVVYIPADQRACPACAGGLFAVVRSYFADTGEPIESAIYVGCVNCEAEIGSPTATALRQWVSSNYRVKT